MAKRRSNEAAECPIAFALESVGDRWSILILRDAHQGTTRFDDFQKSLGIVPTTLTRRLAELVAAGLFARRRYNEHPPRDEYVLTQAGLDFAPVLVSLFAWGRRHFGADGTTVELVDRETGLPADPVIVDATSGAPVDSHHFHFVAGADASSRTVERLSRQRK